MSTEILRRAAALMTHAMDNPLTVARPYLGESA